MRRIHLAQVDSTSAYLRRLAGDPATFPPFWTAVVAERQTAGYGQHGREWESPPGGLYVSVFLPPDLASPLVTLLAGVAAVRACRDVSGADGLGLKWVNDVVWLAPGRDTAGQPRVTGRKIGGLLTEACHRKWLMLGVGINVAPVALPEAAGLEEAAGRPVERAALLEAFLERLHAGAAEWQVAGNGPTLAAWAAESVTLGRRVRVETDGQILEGEATGLDPAGHLLLALADGSVRTVISGTVRLADGRYA